MVLRVVSSGLGKLLTRKRTRRISTCFHHAFSSKTSTTDFELNETTTTAQSRTCQDETDDRLVAFAQRCTTNVASKKKRKKAVLAATKSALSFSEYYRNMYGDRWDGDGGLCHALMDGPSCYAALINRLGDASDAVFEGMQAMKPIPWVHPRTNLMALWIDHGSGRLPPPSISPSSLLLDYYCLDPASLLPVMALNLPNHVESASRSVKILDMCAAPGGKTLAIMQSLFGNPDHVVSSSSLDKYEQHHLVVANEVSRSRRNRLEKVLAEYVPLPLQRSSLSLTGCDGTILGSSSVDPLNGLHFAFNTDGDFASGKEDIDGGFTHVLCDVPCSGERHVLRSSSSLAEWNPGSSRHLQKKQLSLLKAAVSACRPGGTIVYSTCSINVHENDGVVGKLLQKRRNCVELQGKTLADVNIGEETSEYGRMILPDHTSCRGMGPMYICALTKK